jgi:hypothetical protein
LLTRIVGNYYYCVHECVSELELILMCRCHVPPECRIPPTELRDVKKTENLSRVLLSKELWAILLYCNKKLIVKLELI